MLPRYSIRTLLWIFVAAAIAALTFGSALHGTGVAIAAAVMIGAVLAALICQGLFFALYVLVSQASPSDRDATGVRNAGDVIPRGTLDLGE